MARLPTRDDLSGPLSLRSGRAIASYDTSAIGRGLEQFGESVLSVAADRRRESIALDGTAADGGYTRDLNDLERGFDADGDFGTFGRRFDENAVKIRDRWAAKISDPKARALWTAQANERSAGARNRILGLGEQRQREGRLVAARDGLEGYKSVIANPDASEQDRAYARRNAEASIQSLQDAGSLTPSQADDWRKSVLEGGDFALGQREIERNPAAVRGFSGSPEVKQTIIDAATRNGVDPNALLRIAQLESSGNPRARNPNSSAGGLFQFIDSTASRYGLADRYDAAQAADAAARLAKDNAGYLRGVLGREPTAGELYLAHQQGAGGAGKLLANPDALAVDVVGYDAVRLNGGGPGMTAREFAGKWIRKAQGAHVDAPGWFQRLPPEQQLQLERQADAQQRQMDTAAAAQVRANQDATRDSYALRIASTDPTLTREMIAADPVLDDGQKATLVNSYNDKMKDAIATAEAMQAFSAGQLSVDPYDADGRKVVDNLAEQLATTVEPERLAAVTDELIRQTGIVPKPALNAIRLGLSSTSTAQVAGAAQAARRIMTVDPAAFSRRDGGSVVEEAATDFAHYVNDLNLSADDAAQRIIDMRDPAKRASRKALEPAAKDFLQSAAETDLAEVFDPGVLSAEPRLGFNAAQEAGIKADYLAIAEDQFFRTNGDADLAQARALDHMKRLYGVTNLSGDATVMKHPPERYWPAQRNAGGFLGIGSNPWQYARTQLVRDIQEQFGEFDPGSIQLVTVPETDAEVKRGEMPGYVVMWKDGNGNLQTLPGKLWRPDTAVLKQEATQIEKDARREQVQQREQAPYRVQTPEDFLSGNDPVFGER